MKSLAFGLLKGGVGKTTLTGNVGPRKPSPSLVPRGGYGIVECRCGCEGER